MKVREFVDWLYPAAIKAGEVNPIFTVAQAALETGWGEHKIGNNLFGVTKGSTWCGKTQLITTTEYFSRGDRTFKEPEKVLSVHLWKNGLFRYKVRRLFRDYDTIEQGLRDHNDILKRVYPDAWPYRDNPEEFVKHLQDKVGYRYATSIDYVSTMNAIFKSVRRYAP